MKEKRATMLRSSSWQPKAGPCAFFLFLTLLISSASDTYPSNRVDTVLLWALWCAAVPLSLLPPFLPLSKAYSRLQWGGCHASKHSTKWQQVMGKPHGLRAMEQGERTDSHYLSGGMDQPNLETMEAILYEHIGKCEAILQVVLDVKATLQPKNRCTGN
ncbi:hypothetical protein NDU88_005980 [Pleurodeles waltl]|uniref:Uncharacterized protein n=1 Tax=Pleurodeles waltl TaxID=8319 RepID=A0AAV7W9A7_PLEWA|nr:hypothetical protein NDU88_005980 [Pleurodeles waltl]